jgi:hypothetical protein
VLHSLTVNEVVEKDMFESDWNFSRAAYGWRNTIDCTYRCSRPIRYLHDWTVLSNLSSKSTHRYRFNRFSGWWSSPFHSSKNDKERKSSFPFLRWDLNHGPTRPQVDAPNHWAMPTPIGNRHFMFPRVP